MAAVLDWVRGRRAAAGRRAHRPPGPQPRRGIAPLAARPAWPPCAPWWAGTPFRLSSASSPDAIENWRRSGRHFIENRRTRQMMPLDAAVLVDMEAHRKRYDLQAAIAALNVPVLLVQGEEDTTVPPLEMEALAAASGGRAETRMIAGADHTFNSRHPGKRTTPALAEAIRATRSFLLKHLD
ncbi:alpha/beta hydrolase [bacterium]|nr:alpha/beta hydrolase [bacterium]